MKHHAADQLNVEVAHAGGAAGGFADYGECFDKDFFESIVEGVAQRFFLFGCGAAAELGGCHAGFHVLAEPGGAFAELVVGQTLHLGFEGIDLTDDGPQAFEETFIRGAENFCCDFI